MCAAHGTTCGSHCGQSTLSASPSRGWRCRSMSSAARATSCGSLRRPGSASGSAPAWASRSVAKHSLPLPSAVSHHALGKQDAKVLPFNLVSAAYLTQAKSTHAPLREMLSSALSSRLLELVCVCAGGTAAGANKVGPAVLHPSPVPAGKVRLPQAGGCSSRTGNRGPGAARHRDGGRGGGMCHLHEPAGCRADILADGDSVRALLPHQLPKQVDGRQNGMPHLPAAAAAALNPSLASF